MSGLGSQDEKIVFQLHEINKRIVTKFERCAGISQSRLELLHVLYEADEMSQGALQKKVNIDNAAVTRHLKQLEENGTVTRRKNPEDNRVTFVRLTEEGRNRIVAYCEEKQRFITTVLEGVSSEERSQLMNILARVQHNVENIK